MKTFVIDEVHSITVEKANRGIDDDYIVTSYELGRNMGTEYYDRECLEWEYDIKL